MNAKQKLELISRNCQEIIPKDGLFNLLENKDNKKDKKQPSIYLGTAITGRPHIGYFVWVLKLADFLKAGFKVKLLLADLHGALDNTSWEVLDKKYKYYAKILPLMFKAIGADTKNLEIVKGSSFQNSQKYFLDLLKLATMTSVHDAKKAGSEVVKQSDNPKLGGLIYPLMQALDEEYLGVDIQLGGLDQRKILMFAREHLPKLGYNSRIEIMTPILPGLIGKKMSASNPNTKIDLLDDEKTVQKKLKKADCIAGVVEDNGVLAFLKHVIFPILNDNKQSFVIDRPEKFGGKLTYSTYQEVESEFMDNKLHPLDLKLGVASQITSVLSVIQSQRASLEKLATVYNE